MERLTKLIIHNQPDYAKNYEFVVAHQNKDKFFFYGAYANGNEAELAAQRINGVIFHNVKIQGVQK